MITRLRRVSPDVIDRQIKQIKRIANEQGLKLTKLQSKPAWIVWTLDSDLSCMLRWTTESSRWVVEPGNSEVLTVNIREILRSLAY